MVLEPAPAIHTDPAGEEPGSPGIPVGAALGRAREVRRGRPGSGSLRWGKPGGRHGVDSGRRARGREVVPGNQGLLGRSGPHREGAGRRTSRKD